MLHAGVLLAFRADRDAFLLRAIEQGTPILHPLGMPFVRLIPAPKTDPFLVGKAVAAVEGTGAK